MCYNADKAEPSSDSRHSQARLSSVGYLNLASGATEKIGRFWRCAALSAGRDRSGATEKIEDFGGALLYPHERERAERPRKSGDFGGALLYPQEGNRSGATEENREILEVRCLFGRRTENDI